MSDLDSEDSQCRGRSDLVSTLPHYSLVDSTIDLTPLNNQDDDWFLDTTHRRPQFNTTTCFFADKNPTRRGVIPDSNISGPALNTGMSVCYAPPIKTGHRNKGEEFLESSILTTP